MKIDDFPVIAEYIQPTEGEMKPQDIIVKSVEWRSLHVRESQYFTQIVKCDNPACSRLARSSYFDVVVKRFLVPPVPLINTNDDLSAPELGTVDGTYSPFFVLQGINLSALLLRSTFNYTVLPSDFYCPLQQSVLSKRVCSKCGLYHATQVSMKTHRRTCGNTRQVVERVRPVRIAARRQRELMAIIVNSQENESTELIDEEDVDMAGLRIPSATPSEEIRVMSMNEHFNNPWIDK